MQRAVNRKIAEYGQELYGADIDPAGEMWVFEQIARGIPVGKIAQSIQLDPPYDASPPSRRLMYRWRDSGGDARKELWKEAMEAAADELMEKSMTEAEECLPDTGHVSKAKHAHDVRKAIAARQSPEAWGKKSIGEEMAEGMQEMGAGLLKAFLDYGHTGAPGMKRIAAEEPQDADFELLEDGREG